MFGRTFLVAVSFLLAKPVLAETIMLDLPVDCALRTVCFVQQGPDMDGGPGAKGPFCRSNSYDGHKGTDFRVVSMDDLDAETKVLAAADGIVLRVRDGIADRLALTGDERKAVANMECGNGLVIDHGSGWETQYCHLKQNSLEVNVGQAVSRGQALGAIGASGMAAFPHVHLSVRKDDVEIDPFTGAPIGSGCQSSDRAPGQGLWAPDAVAAMGDEPSQILVGGLAAGAVDHADLVMRLPNRPRADDAALVGWASAINLETGDRVKIVIVGPKGEVFSQNVSDPMDRPKATYSLYAGRRGQPMIGQYRIIVDIVRNGKPVVQRVFLQSVS